MKRLAMRRSRPVVLALSWLALWYAPLGIAEMAVDAGLLDELRGGGYVIYFRHAATDWSNPDRVSGLDDVRSCDPTRMRQLSDQGRAQARQIGEAMRSLKIPVDRVLASEYCRTVETARLLGLGEVRTTRDVINARVADRVGGRESLARNARRRLATPPASGSNTVIVAHGNVFLLAAGTRPPEGGAAIVRADGGGGFGVEAILDPADWATLLIIDAQNAKSTGP